MKILIVIGALLVAQHAHAESHQKKLLRHLFSTYDEYDRMARPVTADNASVLVKVGLTINDLVEIEDETLKVAGWLQQSWHDPKLQWNTEDFGGIAEIAFPHRRSWTPDITLFNRVNLDDAVFQDELKIAFADGTVMWVPRGKLEVKCRSSRKPRGQLSCKYTVGSWVYNQNQLDLAFMGKEDIDLSNYQPDAHWHVLKTSADKVVKHFPGVPDPYVTIHFDMVLQHRPRNDISIMNNI